jgi:hypothetical protein
MPAGDGEISVGDSLNTKIIKRTRRAKQLVDDHYRSKKAAPNIPQDFTDAHMATIKGAGHVLVECGGDGDCFYYCMAWLAQNLLPELNLPQSHVALRSTVIDFVRLKWAEIMVQPQVEMITLLRARTSNTARADQTIVNSFCKSWRTPGCCKFRV